MSRRIVVPLTLVVLTALLTQPACMARVERECTRNRDCAAGDFCRAGHCVPARSGRLGPDAASDAAPGPDVLVRCESGVPPGTGELVLNEMLANVPSGPDGDANGDGRRDAYDDEFVELVNAGPQTLDLSGVRLEVGGQVRHTFGADCLEPGHTIVVFGGLADGATPPADAGQVSYVVGDGRLSLSNTSGWIQLRDRDDAVLGEVTYDDAPAEALTLEEQLVPGLYVPHSSLTPDRAMSPGLCADGRAFSTGCR